MRLYGYRLSKVKHYIPCWDQSCATRRATPDEDATRLASTPVRPEGGRRRVVTATAEAAAMYDHAFKEYSANLLGRHMPGFGIGAHRDVHANLPRRGVHLTWRWPLSRMLSRARPARARGSSKGYGK